MLHGHAILDACRESAMHRIILTKLCLAAVVLSTFFLAGCGANEVVSEHPAEQPKANSPRQVIMATRSQYPQVRLSTYTLICDDDLEARKAEAEAVMQVKIELPRAVQTEEADRFERILARDFVFRAKDQFYDRADYIRERVNNKDTVMTADYENVVLQFVGDIAFLTYRNIVVMKPGGPEHTAHMTWADILVKENGQWKFRAVHLIDSK
jgi:ketosteroid isomerase-like protein